MISTGIPYLDRISGGLKLGDNVVWQISHAVPADLFVKSFFTATDDFKESIIYINFNYSPYTIFKRYDYLFKNKKTILIDAFTHGKGNSDPVFMDFYNDDHDYPEENLICVSNPKDSEAFIKLLNDIEGKNKDGSFYIFDSLTGMNDLWKNETKVLDFFTFTCPKLYNLNTLAYWMFVKDAHSKEFIASITHVTQVVFALSSSQSDYFELKIKKLQDRSSYIDNEVNRFKIINQQVYFLDKRGPEQFNVGHKVRDLRKNFKITQTELASYLDMTAGAVSQIENDLTTPSLQTLVQLSSIFNKPLEYFLGIQQKDKSNKGYKLIKKGDQLLPQNNRVAIQQLVEDANLSASPYFITVEGGELLEKPLLMHKGSELIIITSGSITATIQNEEITLKKGDSLYVTSTFISKWHNKNKTSCEMLYILFKS